MRKGPSDREHLKRWGLVDRWFRTLDPRAPRQSQGNINRIDSQIRTHIKVIADVPVGSFDPDDVEAWLRERKDRNGRLLARSTLGKLRSIIAQAYDYGMKRKYVKWNPARVADLPMDADVQPEGRALTAEEAGKLLEYVRGERLGAWIVVGLTLGLRPGEISGLSWHGVDFKRRTLVVYQSLGTDRQLKGTKTGRTRILALPDVTIEALRDHEERQSTERELAGDWPARYADFVFVNSYGRPLERSNTRRMVRGFSQSAGIGNLNPYDLRHTAAELMSETASEWKLADLLGHANTDTVQRHYRHPDTSVIHVADEYWRQGAFRVHTSREIDDPDEPTITPVFVWDG